MKQIAFHLVMILALIFAHVAVFAWGQEVVPIMRCKGDCGPACITAGLQTLGWNGTQDQVERVMGWQHYHSGPLAGLREDLQDSGPAHKMAVLKLGYRYKVRRYRDLLTGTATRGTTVILVRPDARHPTALHWVTMAAPSFSGMPRGHWGDGTTREIPEEWVTAARPSCVYEIVPGPAGKATAWNWLWDSLMRRLF